MQFKVGAAIIPRYKIDNLIKNPAIRDLLSYERQPLDNNCYHGNILLKAEVKKRIKTMVKSGLALRVSEVIPQQQDP